MHNTGDKSTKSGSREDEGQIQQMNSAFTF